MQSKTIEKDYKTVQWLGLSTPVASTKIKQILEKFDHLQLTQTESLDSKVNFFFNFKFFLGISSIIFTRYKNLLQIEYYEKFLSDLRDVIQKIVEENRKAATETTDTHLNATQITLAYLDYLRLYCSSERFLMMISITR